MRPASTALLVLTGGLLVVLGYAIRYGETYADVLQRHPSVGDDAEALAEFVGRWTIVGGALLAALGVAPDALWSGTFLGAVVFALLAVSLYLFFGTWRRLRSSEG